MYPRGSDLKRGQRRLNESCKAVFLGSWLDHGASVCGLPFPPSAASTLAQKLSRRETGTELTVTIVEHPDAGLVEQRLGIWRIADVFAMDVSILHESFRSWMVAEATYASGRRQDSDGVVEDRRPARHHLLSGNRSPVIKGDAPDGGGNDIY